MRKELVYIFFSEFGNVEYRNLFKKANNSILLNFWKVATGLLKFTLDSWNFAVVLIKSMTLPSLVETVLLLATVIMGQSRSFCLNLLQFKDSYGLAVIIGYIIVMSKMLTLTVSRLFYLYYIDHGTWTAISYRKVWNQTKSIESPTF